MNDRTVSVVLKHDVTQRIFKFQCDNKIRLFSDAVTAYITELEEVIENYESVDEAVHP